MNSNSNDLEGLVNVLLKIFSEIPLPVLFIGVIFVLAIFAGLLLRIVEAISEKAKGKQKEEREKLTQVRANQAPKNILIKVIALVAIFDTTAVIMLRGSPRQLTGGDIAFVDLALWPIVSIFATKYYSVTYSTNGNQEARASIYKAVGLTLFGPYLLVLGFLDLAFLFSLFVHPLERGPLKETVYWKWRYSGGDWNIDYNYANDADNLLVLVISVFMLLLIPIGFGMWANGAVLLRQMKKDTKTEG